MNINIQEVVKYHAARVEKGLGTLFDAEQIKNAIPHVPMNIINRVILGVAGEREARIIRDFAQ